jgi:hypothetical protein
MNITIVFRRALLNVKKRRLYRQCTSSLNLPDQTVVTTSTRNSSSSLYPVEVEIEQRVNSLTSIIFLVQHENIFRMFSIRTMNLYRRHIIIIIHHRSCRV